MRIEDLAPLLDAIHASLDDMRAQCTRAEEIARDARAAVDAVEGEIRVARDFYAQSLRQHAGPLPPITIEAPQPISFVVFEYEREYPPCSIVRVDGVAWITKRATSKPPPDSGDDTDDWFCLGG